MSRLHDVAVRAGVSLATASKALNGRDGVSDSTRARVAAVADELGFVPNPNARSLASARSSTVGVLTSDLEGRFALPVLRGAEDAFGAGSLDVILSDARGDPTREQRQIRSLLSRQVDGVIVVGSRTDPRPSLGQHLPVPVVYAYAPSADPADVSYSPDNMAAGRLAAEHLLVRGRTRIAYIGGDRGYAAAVDREIGVTTALRSAGLRPVCSAVFGAWTEQWGRRSAAALLHARPEVDGIVAASDPIARGVLDAVRAAGRRVPDSIAVVSFDNWEMLAEQAVPPLTSIEFDLPNLGRLAAEALSAMRDAGWRSPGAHLTPVRIITRESTSPDLD